MNFDDKNVANSDTRIPVVVSLLGMMLLLLLVKVVKMHAVLAMRCCDRRWHAYIDVCHV